MKKLACYLSVLLLLCVSPMGYALKSCSVTLLVENVSDKPYRYVIKQGANVLSNWRVDPGCVSVSFEFFRTNDDSLLCPFSLHTQIDDKSLADGSLDYLNHEEYALFLRLMDSVIPSDKITEIKVLKDARNARNGDDYWSDSDDYWS